MVKSTCIAVMKTRVQIPVLRQQTESPVRFFVTTAPGQAEMVRFGGLLASSLSEKACAFKLLMAFPHNRCNSKDTHTSFKIPKLTTF